MNWKQLSQSQFTGSYKLNAADLRLGNTLPNKTRYRETKNQIRKQGVADAGDQVHIEVFV